MIRDTSPLLQDLGRRHACVYELPMHDRRLGRHTVSGCLQYAHVLQNIVKTDEVTAQDESNGNRWRLGRELEPASRLEGGVNKWSKYWPWLVGHPR